jgi:shikimate dehydrogenase
LDSDVLASSGTVIDFAYTRSPTALLIAARQLGIRTVNGLDILVFQGALSFERWTGVAPPLGAMRAAAEES